MPACLPASPLPASPLLPAAAVMRDDEDAAEAVRLYAAICRQRAAALRELASSQLQRAARCGAGHAGLAASAGTLLHAACLQWS